MSAAANVRRLSLEAGRKRLDRCDSYERLPVLVNELYRNMNLQDWLALLGEAWSCCDNIGVHCHWLKIALPAQGPVLVMMTDAEREAWAALPDRITIYRGCGLRNIAGASWSLNKQAAERFPYLNRYRQREPLLVTATVSKKKVLALKLERNEAEIITVAARRVCIEKLALERG